MKLFRKKEILRDSTSSKKNYLKAIKWLETMIDSSQSQLEDSGLKEQPYYPFDLLHR